MRSGVYQLVFACLASLILACGDATSPNIQGDYALRWVHIADTLPQPVPAVHVVGGDTTIIERGRLTSITVETWALELVYRWRYNGVSGGATIADTLRSDFERTASFGSDGLVQWFQLLRDTHHVAYLIRRRDGTLILEAYDQAGSVNFYFQR